MAELLELEEKFFTVSLEFSQSQLKVQQRTELKDSSKVLEEVSLVE